MSVIEELVAEFARLPGIGRKTAQRLTYHLLKQPKDATVRLARAVAAVGERVRSCSVCGNLTEADPCAICTDQQRDGSTICVVEEPLDVLAIERTGGFRGLYHVLHGVLSPVEGIGPEHLKLEQLVARVRNGGVREVIMATNPNLEGEATAMYVARLLAPMSVRVTRLARGLPTGADLEYADDVTLARALEYRQDV